MNTVDAWFHDANDAGTSEGARKAWATRKGGGGGASTTPPPPRRGTMPGEAPVGGTRRPPGGGGGGRSESVFEKAKRIDPKRFALEEKIFNAKMHLKQINPKHPMHAKFKTHIAGLEKQLNEHLK